MSIIHKMVKEARSQSPAIDIFIIATLASLIPILALIIEGETLRWDIWLFSFSFTCLCIFMTIGYITFIQMVRIKNQNSVLLTSILSGVLITAPLYLFFKNLFDNTNIQLASIITIFILVSALLYLKIKTANFKQADPTQSDSTKQSIK